MAKRITEGNGMKYTYFISYFASFPDGGFTFGMTEFFTNRTIADFDAVIDASNAIKNKNHFVSVTIISFISFLKRKNDLVQSHP